MTDWELFEAEACHYLNELYKNTPITFHETGGKDAYSSDIQVFSGEEYLFSIEAKYAPCQSGQFVLLEENDTYKLSAASTFEQNDYTEEIIRFLNEHKHHYSPKGQRALPIEMTQDVLAGWVVEHYKRKDSHFIITSTKLNDYKAMIPMERVGDYFNVSAVLRRKRSGTSYVARKRMAHCLEELEKYAMERDVTIEKITHGKKPSVRFQQDIELTRAESYVGEDYFLSRIRGERGYYLKTRSKTNNLNVIFTLDYIGPEENIGVPTLDEMIRAYH